MANKIIRKFPPIKGEYPPKGATIRIPDLINEKVKIVLEEIKNEILSIIDKKIGKLF